MGFRVPQAAAAVARALGELGIGLLRSEVLKRNCMPQRLFDIRPARTKFRSDARLANKHLHPHSSSRPLMTLSRWVKVRARVDRGQLFIPETRLREVGYKCHNYKVVLLLSIMG